MAVVDVITYAGEKDIFDIRYNILKDYVDTFVVVEFDQTFSGYPKPLYFQQIFDKYPKVCYTKVIGTPYNKYLDLAKSSPNTVGAEHWKREFCQKEYIKDCLVGLDDEDIVFIGDADEIPDMSMANLLLDSPFKLRLKVYTYYLNNHSTEEFWGTLRSSYYHIKYSCLNHLRTNAWKTGFDAGWHFTSMAKSLKQKLKDSYTDEDYATDEILEQVDENIENDRDFLGRPFKYTKDESNWPQYLKDNKAKYKHLLK